MRLPYAQILGPILEGQFERGSDPIVRAAPDDRPVGRKAERAFESPAGNVRDIVEEMQTPALP